MSEVQASALVVDDDPVSRQIVIRTLTRTGYACDAAGDGAEARERLASAAYDLLVTDLHMPNVNGHTLCVELLEKTPRPTIVVLTGITEPRLAKDLLARGVERVLFKPINCVNLAEIARDTIAMLREA
jgi:CheY-like chemotaxis protein